MIAARDEYKITRLSIPAADAPTQFKVESLWVKAQIGHNRTVVVACIYRPPGGSTVEADYEELERQIQHVMSQHRGLIMVLGDLNSDLWPDNPPGAAARRLKALLEQYDLVQTVQSRTFRVVDEYKSLLDESHLHKLN